MARDGGQEHRGDAVRQLRDGWRTADEARRREDRDEGTSDERDGQRDQRRSDSLDSLDRIRAHAPDTDLETRRAADAAEREIERAQRRSDP